MSEAPRREATELYQTHSSPEETKYESPARQCRLKKEREQRVRGRQDSRESPMFIHHISCAHIAL